MVEEQNAKDQLFSWQADEFQTQSRSNWWYGIALVIMVLIGGYIVYIQSWFVLGVVVMVAIALYVLGCATPRKFTHIITNKGIKVGENFYAYDLLKKFWIVKREKGGASLNIVTSKRFDLILTLQMQGDDVETVRQILSEFLPEDAEKEEDIVDRIGRFFKF